MKHIATTDRNTVLVEMSLSDLEDLNAFTNTANVARNKQADDLQASDPVMADVITGIANLATAYWMDLYHLEQVAKGNRPAGDRPLRTEDF